MYTEPTHLLASLGILTSFSIAKKVNKKEVDKIVNSLKKTYKGKSQKKFEEILKNKLIENTKKYVSKEIPPGLILPERHKLDSYYEELIVITQLLFDKFKEEKLTKQQICFIVNGILNMFQITEEEFSEFYKNFEKYKQEKFGNDGEKE